MLFFAVVTADGHLGLGWPDAEPHSCSASIAVAGLAVGHQGLPSMCSIRPLAQAWQAGRLSLLAVD